MTPHEAVGVAVDGPLRGRRRDPILFLVSAKRIDPPELPVMVRRDEALAAGLTPDEIRQRVRGGRWRRLATGVYLRGDVDPPVDVYAAMREEHVYRARAVARAHPDCVIGFGSAALVHGLPLVSGVPALVQLLVPEGAWTGIRKGVRFRACHLGREDLSNGDVAVTSPTRTCIDIARTHRLPDALSVGDRAHREGLIDLGDTAWALRQLGSIRGVRLAGAALRHIDGRRENALESWSFATFVSWEIPLPTPQVEIRDDFGFIGRVDFDWTDHGVVGEADGRLKYVRADALYEEKRREDRLRAKGLQVIRWGWQDLLTGQSSLRSRIESALRR